MVWSGWDGNDMIEQRGSWLDQRSLDIHLRFLQFLFLESAEIGHRRVFPDGSFWLLVGLDLCNVAESISQRHEFAKLRHCLWEHSSDQAHQLIDKEVHHSKVIKVPSFLGTIVLIIPEDGLDFVTPNLHQSSLILLISADESFDRTLEVMPTLHAVDAQLAGEVATH
jgi:hypothetical protein